jgi:methylenetetrahydrofolate dehydrogenase (NADP+)/methenyltetrahydrofolate cyclohydrolase
MAVILDGRKVSSLIKEEIRSKIDPFSDEMVPCLAVILVGNDNASRLYVRNKMKACMLTHIRSLQFNLPEETGEDELLSLIERLDASPDVDGILVQLPLPESIDEKKILERIDPGKDVDGFHPINKGRLFEGSDCFVPCTPAGIIELLKYYNIDLDGKNCVIVGRSNIVGKPAAFLLLKENATVTICHSHSKNIRKYLQNADIIVSAVGKARFITEDMVKSNAVIIDVGMNRDEHGKLVGDIDYEKIFPKASYITPVPGGVGPMTIAMLMKNVFKARGIEKHK